MKLQYFDNHKECLRFAIIHISLTGLSLGLAAEP